MFSEFGGAFDEFGGAFCDFGCGFGSGGVEMSFGVDFDEFDEFGSAFAVCSWHLEMYLMSLGERCMSLDVA